ncbi:MAG: hypothetical protein HY862_01535 [Chloroflexi bacterium]|nr:hypothetical protein [Chloroflexota bacterium]
MRRKKLSTPIQQPNGAPTLTHNTAPPIGMVKPLAEEPPSWLFVGFIGIGTGLLLVSCMVLAGVAYWILNNRDDEGDKTTEVGTPSTPPTATIFVVGEVPTLGPTNSPTIELSPTSTRTATIPPTSTVAGPTLTYTLVPPTRIPATNTPTASRTLLPTNTGEPTMPPTSGPTATIGFTALPTNTPDALLPTSNSLPAGAVSSPTATILPPPTLTATVATGQRIRLFYDNASLYLWNPTRNQIALTNLAFEAIDSTGLSVGYRFDGSRWAEFYEYAEPNGCASIEITTGPTWLRPRQCIDYNAQVTPPSSAPFIFWVARSGVTQFRVLWNEQEIGRCNISGGQCDVFLP